MSLIANNGLKKLSKQFISYNPFFRIILVKDSEFRTKSALQ